MGLGVFPVKVVAVVGGHQGQGEFPGQCLQVPVHQGLLGHLVGLDFQVKAIVVKDGGQLHGSLSGLLPAPLSKKPWDHALETGGKGDETPVVFSKEIQIDPGVIVKAFQMSQGHQAVEVAVPLFIHDEQDQVMGGGSPAGRCGPVLPALRGHVDLASQDGVNAGFSGCLKVLNRAEDVAVIRDGYGLHTQMDRPFLEPRNGDGAVQEAELGVDVQMDERGGVWHGLPFYVSENESAVVEGVSRLSL